MPVAVNDKGEYLTLDQQGQWSPAMIADNPQSGEKLFLDGSEWKPLPKQEIGLGTRLAQGARVADKAAGGFLDSAAETVGAVPDAVAWGMRQISPSIAPPERFYSDAIKSGLKAAGGAMSAPVNQAVNSAIPQGVPPLPEAEKIAYGAGRGAGDAASIFLPASAIARGAQSGSTLAGIARTMASQPVMQAVSGAVGGGVSAGTDNPLYGAAAALATPFVAGGLRRAISPVANQLNPEQARLARIAEQEGINLTAGQRTGSKPLQTTESVLENLPFTSGPQRAIRQGQQEAFNRAVLQRAGVNADRATPDVVDNAFRGLGQQFNDLSARNTVAVDNQLMTDLQDVATRYGRKLPSQQREIVNNYIDDILNGGNTMPGQTYQITRSDLGKQAKATANSDGTLSDALRGLRNALDGAATRSISPDDAQAWDYARQHYGNLKTISRAVSSSGAGSASGDVSPGQLWNAAKASSTQDQFSRGMGDLNDLSRVGQTFLKSQVGDSGTAQRSTITSLLTGSGIGTAGMASGGDPVTMAMGGGAALLLPRLAQALMNSGPGQAYLSNQLMQPRSAQDYAALVAALTGAQGKSALLSPPQR
jgi:hypothetical protein